jgi:hypothetical protein
MGNETIKEEGQGGDASRCVYQHSPEWDLPDGWPLAKNRMPERNLDCTQRGLVVRARVLLGLAVLSLFVVGLFTAGCAGSPVQGQTSQTDREATLRRIASEYAQDQDLARAQTNLSKLGLANPAQLLVTLAEQDISQGRSREEVEPLARLADGLGARSPILRRPFRLRPRPNRPARRLRPRIRRSRQRPPLRPHSLHPLSQRPLRRSRA